MARLHIRQDARPKLYAIAYGERVGMRSTLVGTRQHVQSTQDDLAPAAAVPMSKVERPPGESQMDGNSHDFRQGPKGRPSVKQVFVPISNLPVFRRGRREGGESEGRSKHVFAEARMRVFRIEGIDQQCITRLYGSGRGRGVKERRPGHFGWTPTAPRRLKRRSGY